MARKLEPRNPNPNTPLNIQIEDRKLIKEWNRHYDLWNNCQACPLHKTTHRRVFYRGSIPCEVLFIGEAPGRTETVLGYPFVGRSGRLLDKLLDASMVCLKREFSYGITNIVACVPFKDDDDSKEFRPPTVGEAEHCFDRLLEAVNLATPAACVLLGKSAQRFFEIEMHCPVHNLPHPAYMARLGGVTSAEFKRCLLSLSDFLRPIL